jgi:regulator of PEP synthase PpsR (kinase-PPPase family)
MTIGRNIYFISDGTGITVEALGHSLLTQFSHLVYSIKKYPYVNTTSKAQEILKEIQTESVTNFFNQRPIIFSTLISSEIRNIIKQSNAFILDLFELYINPLELELGSKSEHRIGKSHGLKDEVIYDARMEAINFTLNTDDGMATQKYKNAEIILVGVSRCGKTPTCLYMAIKYGIKAANYPLVMEDLEQNKLPDFLEEHKNKIYGLSIDPKRLQTIRQKRLPDSQYAALQQCQLEIKMAENLFIRENIPFLFTTVHSIEEITTHILEDKGIGSII